MIIPVCGALPRQALPRVPLVTSSRSSTST